VNAALAVVKAAALKDEIEGALAVQMARTHTAAMAILAKLDSGSGTERRWRRLHLGWPPIAFGHINGRPLRLAVGVSAPE
jgi:hypothetical protein